MRDYGYPAMARCEALRGSSAARIAWVCQRAWRDGAPFDAVYRQHGAWVLDAEVTDPMERLALGLSPLAAVQDGAPVAVRHTDVPVQPAPTGRPVAGTVPVKVRWTVDYEGVVEIPAQAAATGRAVVAWLQGHPAWAAGAVLAMPSSAPRVREVIVPRFLDGRLTPADRAELADKVRELVKTAEADGTQRRPLLS
jgi:hypothetical protein